MTLIFLGMITGIILSLTGAGGSIIAIPLLVWVVKMDITQAIPTALIAVAISASIGAAIGLKKGIVRYKAAMYLSSMGVVFSPLGIFLASIAATWLLNALMTALLFYISIKSFIDSNEKTLSKNTLSSQPMCVTEAAHAKLVWNAPCFYALGFSGALAGFFSGLLGIGGGLIIVPALKKFTNLTHESIIATSLMIITCTSLSGVFFASLKGNIHFHLTISFSIGTLLGMWIGKYITKKISTAHKQKIFAVVAACSAILLLSKSIF
jgi:uncharacterized protein